jgi:hypothetical protein
MAGCGVDEATVSGILHDALTDLLDELRSYAEAHNGQFPVSSECYFKACAALRLLEEEP